jgi:hypothetical protein
MHTGKRKIYNYRITKEKKIEYKIEENWVDSHIIDGLNELASIDSLDSYYKEKIKEEPSLKKTFSQIERFRNLLNQNEVELKKVKWVNEQIDDQEL